MRGFLTAFAVLGVVPLRCEADIASFPRNETSEKHAQARLLQQLAQGVRAESSIADLPLNQLATLKHCEVKSRVALTSAQNSLQYPGGATQDSSRNSFARQVQRWGELSKGPSSVTIVGQQSTKRGRVALGAGMMQSLFAAAVHTVPPLVPPPAWTNRPLPCVPMVSGHNCFGAVLYPITFADFIVADVTDSIMDGYMASFPNTFASKVGKASDAVYKSCFASYMSLQCSSIFPRCISPDSADSPAPATGRVPPCLHMCILPLVMCPGFWIGDVQGPCQATALPPMCTQAFFWNLWRLPSQYVSYDEANPYPVECPSESRGSAESDSEGSNTPSSTVGSSPTQDAATSPYYQNQEHRTSGR